MTTAAVPTNIKGPFDGQPVVVDGFTSVPFREGDDFLMTLVHPEWEAAVRQQGGDPRAAAAPPTQTYRIDRVIGSHHQQVYLSRAPDGGYHTLPLVWDIVRTRWITRKSSFLTPPRDGFYHNTKLWNNGCIFCHNTGPRPRLQVQSSPLGTSYTWNSAVAELGIACEACHGAGQAHVNKHRLPGKGAQERAATPSAESDLSLADIVRPRLLSKERAVLMCARCHGKMVARSEFDRGCLVEGDFFDPRDADYSRWYDVPALAADQDYQEQTQGKYFWSDGTPRTTALEYQGVTASACYQQGQMTCFSCHSMHAPHGSDPNDQLRFADAAELPSAQHNRACTQCHQSLTTEDALAAHTHHAAGSAGSRCYNCHMPYQTYALHKRVRSHRITIPTAAVTRQHGVPNACNQCHVDRSTDWTDRMLAGWQNEGAASAGRSDRAADDAAVFAASAELSMVVEHALAGHALQRALAMEQLGDPTNFAVAGTQWRARILLSALEDEYESVRLLAGQSLLRLPGFNEQTFDFLAAPAVRGRQVAALRQWAATQDSEQAREQLARVLGTSPDHIEQQINALRQRRNEVPVSINE